MNLNEFKQVLSQNEQLKEKFEQRIAQYENVPTEATAQAAAKIAADLGYDVPASEFALAEIGDQELSEDELDRVAGGGSGICDDAATCDYSFKHSERPGKSKRCKVFLYCDEYLKPFYCAADYQERETDYC